MLRQLPEPTDGNGPVNTGGLRIGINPTGVFLDFIDAEMFANTLREYLAIQQERFARPNEQALFESIKSMEKLIRASIQP